MGTMKQVAADGLPLSGTTLLGRCRDKVEIDGIPE